MIIRRAKDEEASAIASCIFLAIEEIIYHFIGENNKAKAIQLLTSLIQEPSNQYSFENCWVVLLEEKIVAATLIYDGAKLSELRTPVAEKINAMPHSNFNPEDETQAGEYYIDSVGVNPDHQGKGLGTLIFNFLIDKYVHQQNQTLGLLVDFENPNAQKLYLKIGFEKVGEKTLTGKRMHHLQFKPKN